MDKKPLLTFAVLGYNQENFIRDAVLGAFRQTYSPLEILLSDDCSPDGTFEIMREMASGYEGPHTIILNRNPSNLGLGGNINRAMELSKGELVVVAAGDDVSLPERTSLIYEGWKFSGGAATSLYSSYTAIDKENRVCAGLACGDKQEQGPPFESQTGDLLSYLSTWHPMVTGCTHAWSRRLFGFFGMLPGNLMQEDLVLSFRSLAIGGIVFIKRPLVKYRRHEANLSLHTADLTNDFRTFEAHETKQKTMLNRIIIAYDALIGDIETLRRKKSFDSQYIAVLEREARRVRELYAVELRMISESFQGRVRVFYHVLKQGNLRLGLKLAPQLFPKRVYHNLRTVKWKIISRINQRGAV